MVTMSDRTNWESHWPSDDELLGRAERLAMSMLARASYR